MSLLGRPGAGALLVLCLAALAPRGPLVAIRTEQGGSGVLIFAAASMQTALDELAPDIERSIGVRVRTSYAASSALARQIDSGAPADIFVSADLEWMDFLEAHQRIQPGSRVDLLGNRLVLIKPAGHDVVLRIGPRFPLAQALGRDRLAVADPASVPAGKYAQRALMSLGVWSDVAGRLAPAENVRGALLLVSRGETPLGIVYRSDALADRGVAIVDVFPESTHPRIVYPAALTTTASAEGRRALAFLHGEAAGRVFARPGFIVGVPGGPRGGPTSR